MAKKLKTSRAQRLRRHARVRRRVEGSAERPRLAVYRSLSHIYAQVIEDGKGHTVASACSLDAPIKEQKNGGNKTSVATLVGKLIAERAKAAGVTKVVFDRGGFLYHGRVKAVADAAREAGLEF